MRILAREMGQLGYGVTHRERKDKPIMSSYADESAMSQSRGRCKLAEMIIYKCFPV